ncbi:MAG: peptidoglycan-binding domain-containing protein [Minisyncoccia bacterium]
MKKYKVVLIFLFFGFLIIPFTIKATTIYNFGATTLRNGSRGEAVMELQRFLNTTLNLGLIVDGKLGPKTIIVIKKWQNDHGLKADGFIGKNTKAMMNFSLTPNPTNTNISTPNSVTIYTPTLSTIPDNTPTSLYDCNQKSFTMALIFVARDINDPTFLSQKQRYTDELAYVKNRFPWSFGFATGGLAIMSIPDDAVFMDGKILGITPENFNIALITKKFYETHGDNYDFISIFTNTTNTTGSNYHFNTINNIGGIGLSSSYSNNSSTYGSNRKLEGINYLDDLLDVDSTKNCYLQEKNNLGLLTIGNNCGMLTLLHETAHQWGVFVGDSLDTSDPTGLDLPVKNSGAHYSMLLTSPAGTKDTLGGIAWKKSSNNSVAYIYDEDNASNLIKDHPFTIYFMGLLPQAEYDTKFDILQKETSYQDGNTQRMAMESVYKQVSVRDIIKKEGVRSCIK